MLVESVAAEWRLFFFFFSDFLSTVKVDWTSPFAFQHEQRRYQDFRKGERERQPKHMPLQEAHFPCSSLPSSREVESGDLRAEPLPSPRLCHRYEQDSTLPGLDYTVDCFQSSWNISEMSQICVRYQCPAAMIMFLHLCTWMCSKHETLLISICFRYWVSGRHGYQLEGKNEPYTSKYCQECHDPPRIISAWHENWRSPNSYTRLRPDRADWGDHKLPWRYGTMLIYLSNSQVKKEYSVWRFLLWVTVLKPFASILGELSFRFEFWCLVL